MEFKYTAWQILKYMVFDTPPFQNHRFYTSKRSAYSTPFPPPQARAKRAETKRVRPRTLGKDLQRTLHPIRAYQTQSDLEVRRCRGSALDK